MWEKVVMSAIMVMSWIYVAIGGHVRRLRRIEASGRLAAAGRSMQGVDPDL